MKTVPVSKAGTEVGLVSRALSHWPTVTDAEPAIRRPFFMTIHFAGRRMTASGIMQYYGPRDFRLTAANELGAVLFDGRVNWAGVNILRKVQGMDSAVVKTLLEDLSKGFELPEDLRGLQVEENGQHFVLETTPGDKHKIRWIFDGSTGLLRVTNVELGLLDTLHVEYRMYNARGWPEEVTISRKARSLDVAITFTDNTLVQNASDGGNSSTHGKVGGGNP